MKPNEYRAMSGSSFKYMTDEELELLDKATNMEANLFKAMVVAAKHYGSSRVIIDSVEKIMCGCCRSAIMPLPKIIGWEMEYYQEFLDMIQCPRGDHKITDPPLTGKALEKLKWETSTTSYTKLPDFYRDQPLRELMSNRDQNYK